MESKQYSLEEILINSNKIIEEVTEGEAIKITRDGKEFAVIISQAEYEKLSNKKQSFWESIKRFREEYNVEAADIDPSEIFAGVRDKSPGREVIF